ncbi:MAG TPA: hypothetical protein VK578_03145 [Edaphobacter sp.]|nr:hypothetical protein [Edaphobacter sp.]
MSMSSRAVKITTPIPTLQQVGERLGLSKSRQNAVLSIVRRDSTAGMYVERTRADRRVSPGSAKKSVKK